MLNSSLRSLGVIALRYGKHCFSRVTDINGASSGRLLHFFNTSITEGTYAVTCFFTMRCYSVMLISTSDVAMIFTNASV